MKIATILGARPQFIKAAAVSRGIARHNSEIGKSRSLFVDDCLSKSHQPSTINHQLTTNDRRPTINEILIHTGQHYDANMSQIFFDELGIPCPNYNLGIGSGGHGAQTGAMLSAIEEILLKEKPDRVLVYGDTNSTLAGALAAVKLHIPIAHVEAGLRSFNRHMPEEINRLVTDHVADQLFCPSETAVTNLASEGITAGVYLVGDVMYEALMHAVDVGQRQSDILDRLNLAAGGYILATIHRAENTDDPARLTKIMEALQEVSRQIPVILPIHPRTRSCLAALGLLPSFSDKCLQTKVHCIPPLGYLDMVRLEAGASVIMTDSGGVQKEAYWLRVPCVTLRDETEWVETVQQGWNVLVGKELNNVLMCALSPHRPESMQDIYAGKGSVNRLINAFICIL